MAKDTDFLILIMIDISTLPGIEKLQTARLSRCNSPETLGSNTQRVPIV